MKAKAQALDEMTESGMLTDFTSPSSYSSGGTDIDSELNKVSMNASVDQELAKMKANLNKTQ